MNSKRILLVDIGNTSVCVAVGTGNAVGRVHRLATDHCRPECVRRIVSQAAGRRRMAGGVLCSVVPGLNRLWTREMTRVAGGVPPVVVSYKAKLGIRLKYPKPGTIGADRLANACGAFRRYGGPTLVVDFGTATTFDLVTAEGEFAGGVIAPGFRAMTDYMNERTALLPKIPFDGVCMRIGRSTVEAMTIGARIGYRGLIREIVEYLVKGNHLRNPTLVATGGLARIALANSGLPFHIDQTLTLKALLDIFRLNVRTSKQG